MKGWCGAWKASLAGCHLGTAAPGLDMEVSCTSGCTGLTPGEDEDGGPQDMAMGTHLQQGSGVGKMKKDSDFDHEG